MFFLASALLCRLLATLVLSQSVWRTFKLLKRGAATPTLAAAAAAAPHAHARSDSNTLARRARNGAADAAAASRSATGEEGGADTPAALLRTWTILSALAVCESSVEFLLSWLPFYYEVGPASRGP